MSQDLTESNSALMSRTQQVVEDSKLMKNLAQIASYMAESRLVPKHLQNSKSDCLLVVMQAYRWGMDPFATAQKTYLVHGKMGYEGQLVASVINTSGEIQGRLKYNLFGEGNDRGVVVSGQLKGEEEERTVQTTLQEARTQNERWKKDPDQMLCYYGARKWARRHMPELLMGVYAEDELQGTEQTEKPRHAEKLAKPGEEVEPEKTETEAEPEEPEQKEAPQEDSKSDVGDVF